MQTNRLTVRRFRREDAGSLFLLLSDREVMRYIEPPYSMEQTVSFLERAGLCDPPLIFAVDGPEGSLAGYAIYHPYGADAYEIGWLLHKSQWGKGYARELTQGLIRFAKGKTRYLVLECHPEQAATRHIALSCGFSYRGREDGCDVYRLDLEG